jgi:hypothetical protein
MMSSMRHFVHDDQGYDDWLAQHPRWLVINTYTRPSPAYLKLHRASCRTISYLEPPGKSSFTEGDYSKLCGGRRAG